MFVRKSLFIGISRGNSEDSSYPGAVTPEDLGQVLGTVLHDGPTYFDSCWFTGFYTNGDYIAAAIGFAPKNKFHSSVVSSVSDMRFGFVDGVEGTRVFDGLVDDSVQGTAEFDCDETATFRDADGSVTSCPAAAWSGPVQLVKPEVSYLTDRCRYRDEWNMAICEDDYGKVIVDVKEYYDGQTMETFDNEGQMRRRRYDNPDEILVEHIQDAILTQYMTILGSEEYYYEFQYVNEFPKRIRFTGRGVEKNSSVVVGACLPEGVTSDDFDLFVRFSDDSVLGGKKFQFVDKLEDLASDKSMTKVFLDGRMLYIRLSSFSSRSEDWDRHDTDHCPGETCPRVNIIMNKELTYSPCFPTNEGVSSNADAMDQLTRLTCEMPASTPDPDWGARDTLASEDGSWGQWSSWSDCCNDEFTTMKTTRYRLCDDPPPRGSGATCVGESEQTTTCQKSCPVDGVWADWTDFTDCFCDGVAVGSGGVRYKTRACEGTAHGGKYCNGPYIFYAMCRKTCGLRTEEAVDGTKTEWTTWTDCFCDGLGTGSSGVRTRSRSCEGTAGVGDFCSGPFEEVDSCYGDCFPEN